MAILEIVKEGQEEKNSRNITQEELSLSNLNQKKSCSFDFMQDKNPEMAFGKLKTERGITRIIISTLINVILFIGSLVGIIYLFIKYSNISFVLFKEKNYYTLDAFNSELIKFLLILFILLVISCIICAVFINLSIRIRFRKFYLNSTNIYVYDVFLAILNILIYVLIGVSFFAVINNYNNKFAKWHAEKILSPEVNLGIIDVFKYIVVILIAIFISLNILRGIKITYEKNKFIFENHL